MQQIIMKNIDDPQMQQSQFSCDIARATTQLSFHSCNYGISNGWCSDGIPRRRSCQLHFLSHGHDAAIVETNRRLEDVGHDNSM